VSINLLYKRTNNISRICIKLFRSRHGGVSRRVYLQIYSVVRRDLVYLCEPASCEYSVIIESQKRLNRSRSK